MTDANPPDDDFGALLEASLGRPRRRFTIGEKVRGTVMQVGHESLIVDLGDGQDGILPLEALGEPETRPEIREGDPVEAYILGFEDRVAELGLRVGRGSGGAGRARLEDAFRTGLPVEGVVTATNKGGFVVEIGGARAFCPMGAMDNRRFEDPAIWVGRKLLFRVTGLEGDRDVVVSRRAILDEENARRAAETRERLVVGERMSGTVTSIREFGAFVDLGGIDGLIPVSEMGFGRRNVEDVVKLGDNVHVEILRMEDKDGKERITLSMKALQDDPFGEIASALQKGMIVAGRVTRVQPFGAFVELVPGVEGLIHVSAFGRRIGHPMDVVKPGQEIAVRVEGVDAEARRIALHAADAAELAVSDVVPGAHGLRVLRHAEPEPERPLLVAGEERERSPAPASSSAKTGDVVETIVDRVEAYGVFVSWPGGRGLVPSRELGVPRNTDLRRQIKPGSSMKAVIIDVRDDGKITLSKTAVERAEERADTDAYRKQATPSMGSGLGTLGDLLAAKRKR